MANSYLPYPAKILKIEDLSATVKLFRLNPQWKLKQNKNGVFFTPAQFVLAGIWGVGEAPFGIASSPYEGDYIEIAVRRVGSLTGVLHNLKEGDEVTVRGPYGNGYPLDFFEKKDIIMLTGGCGIPPIASLVEYIVKNREKFNRVYLLYGAKTPQDLLFRDEYARWKKYIELLLTVDIPDKTWHGSVGLIPELAKYIKVDALSCAVAMCGPGPMTKAIEGILRPLGVADRRIYVSEERRMKCGIGKCQHCVCGKKYVCLDGPVFNFDEIDTNWD